MPDNISVNDFLKEAWDDYNSPTTSSFVSKLGQCRAAVASLEETLDYDRSGLNKLKKSIKALYSSGNLHFGNESYLSENLEKLGHSSSKEHESDISTAFLKFAVVTKELSALMKNLMQSLNNIVLFPLDSFLHGDFSGLKGDLKKPFDKAWKDYDSKFGKIEKEKKQQAKDAGMIKTEVTGPEIAEEMERERQVLQLQMCEYLLRVNDIKTKKGVDMLQHLVEFYQAQNNYFQDGLKTIEHFRCYIEELGLQLERLKQKQATERRQLIEFRDTLKERMSSYKETTPATTGYNLHQLQGNKLHGNEKKGFLLKKSEGKIKKVWQKRHCFIKDGFLSISHSDTSKEPVKLNLLTCQVKLIYDDPVKRCFDLISSSKNRTYHFQADDSQEMQEWISVLNNAKELVLMKAFGETSTSSSEPYNQSMKELTGRIIQELKRLPGNDVCCDCGAPGPEWLSVNLGVLICLECCGVHRDMGVHISRTQSIVIDELSTAQLLLSRKMGNQNFNEIMEATLDNKTKPTPRSSMDEKKTFIRSKYEKRRYAIVTCADIEDRRQDLKQAILSQDIMALLQVYAEGIDFMEPLPEMLTDENALHLSIIHEDGRSLFLVDFIIQNTNSQELNRRTTDGNTPLHLCSIYNHTECMKLLLRTQPDLVNYSNSEGYTALDIATNLKHELCIDLLNHAIAGKSDLFENLNIDWDFIMDEQHFVDNSDDELEVSTPERCKTRSRPGSFVMINDRDLSFVGGLSQQDRSYTTDNLKLSLPPPSSSSSSSSSFHPTSFANQRQKLPSSSSYPVESGSVSHLPPTSRDAASRKKAPAPPPPAGHRGHLRNPSDPGFGHFSLYSRSRSPSDPPPPLPQKTGRPKIPPESDMTLSAPPPPMISSKPQNSTRLSKSLSTSQTSDDVVPSQIPPPLPAKPRQSLTTSSSQLLSNTPSVAARTSILSTTNSKSKMMPDDQKKRCITCYKCAADNDDELSFEEGEIIVILREDEEDWWEGEIEGQSNRKGMFPALFVRLLDNNSRIT